MLKRTRRCTTRRLRSRVAARLFLQAIENRGLLIRIVREREVKKKKVLGQSIKIMSLEVPCTEALHRRSNRREASDATDHDLLVDDSDQFHHTAGRQLFSQHVNHRENHRLQFKKLWRENQRINVT